MYVISLKGKRQKHTKGVGTFTSSLTPLLL
jgi:hypothetical protein